MDFNKILRQPTTILGLGVLFALITWLLTTFAGGTPMVADVIAVLAFAATHIGIDDHSAFAQAIVKTASDGLKVYESHQGLTAAPVLINDLMADYQEFQAWKAKQSAPSSTGPATAALAMLGLLGMFGLAACTPAEQAQVTQALTIACQVDGQAQPVLVAVAPSLVPQLASVAATDAALVHPLVVGLCNGVAAGAKPVSVTK